MVSSLCGVDVNYSGDYINDLKMAIGNYDINHKIGINSIEDFNNLINTNI